jgi:hypothetical protein
MADTKHHAHAATPSPVEGDGVSYSGIVWFVVLLAATTLICQVLMVVLLKAFQYQASTNQVEPSPLAARVDVRDAPEGRVYPDMKSIGLKSGPQPQLLVREPANLADLRAHEHEVLTTYDWVDKAAGTVRMPIDKAKDKLIEQGLPVRGTEPAKDPKAAKEIKK